MNQAPFSTLHDVSLVLRRLADRAGVGSTTEHGPRAPEEMLGSLLDVGATVRLSDHLAIRAPLQAPIRADGGHGALHSRVDRKIAEIRRELAEAWTAPFEGRRAAPGLRETHEALARAGHFESRDEAKLLAVARRLAPFQRERFDHQLSRGRQRVRWIRVDVTAELRALGPRAMELEAFDTVYSRACEPGHVKLVQRLERSLDACFERLFVALASALPLEADAADLAPWFEPRGAISRHHVDLGALATALVDYELDALLALVDTAWANRSEEITA